MKHNILVSSVTVPFTYLYSNYFEYLPIQAQTCNCYTDFKKIICKISYNFFIYNY